MKWNEVTSKQIKRLKKVTNRIPDDRFGSELRILLRKCIQIGQIQSEVKWDEVKSRPMKRKWSEMKWRQGQWSDVKKMYWNWMVDFVKKMCWNWIDLRSWSAWGIWGRFLNPIWRSEMLDFVKKMCWNWIDLRSRSAWGVWGGSLSRFGGPK